MVAMLMQFKNKQRKIASITVSLFMGSWLLLLCQTCFAADNAIKSHSEPSTETSSSCHTPENIALEQRLGSQVATPFTSVQILT